MLLSDGKTTTGRDPVAVAEAAGRLACPDLHGRLGTEDGRHEPGLRPAAPGPARPGDAEAIAEESGGRSFSAGRAAALSIYKDLG